MFLISSVKKTIPFSEKDIPSIYKLLKKYLLSAQDIEKSHKAAPDSRIIVKTDEKTIRVDCFHTHPIALRFNGKIIILTESDSIVLSDFIKILKFDQENELK